MEKVAYDQVTEKDKRPINSSFKIMVEEYSLLKMAGDITNRRVLDLACGDGHYTRKLIEAGASEIVGVDPCAASVSSAKAQEEDNTLGCQYVISEIAQMPKMDQFDMATAMYLLNRAKTKKELVGMLKCIYEQLKPGAQLIGFNDNPMNDPANDSISRKYGVLKDGSNSQIDHYHLSPKTYTAAFKEAGFVNFEWMWPSLHPAERGNEYWDEFMFNPPVMGFVAYKEEDVFRHRRSYVGWAVQNVWML